MICRLIVGLVVVVVGCICRFLRHHTWTSTDWSEKRGEKREAVCCYRMHEERRSVRFFYSWFSTTCNWQNLRAALAEVWGSNIEVIEAIIISKEAPKGWRVGSLIQRDGIENSSKCNHCSRFCRGIIMRCWLCCSSSAETKKWDLVGGKFYPLFFIGGNFYEFCESKSPKTRLSFG